MSNARRQKYCIFCFGAFLSNPKIEVLKSNFRMKSPFCGLIKQ
ncbi:hypothetical protein LEP1GSC168_3161 [Leptospira santarosai str. HAI134]|nr:hypothetical protein LEP1GSC168_3161 [Leptospira santarosai str. HAI134]